MVFSIELKILFFYSGIISVLNEKKSVFCLDPLNFICHDVNMKVKKSYIMVSRDMKS